MALEVSSSFLLAAENARERSIAILSEVEDCTVHTKPVDSFECVKAAHNFEGSWRFRFNLPKENFDQNGQRQ